MAEILDFGGVKEEGGTSTLGIIFPAHPFVTIFSCIFSWYVLYYLCQEVLPWDKRKN